MKPELRLQAKINDAIGEHHCMSLGTSQVVGVLAEEIKDLINSLRCDGSFEKISKELDVLPLALDARRKELDAEDADRLRQLAEARKINAKVK